MSPDDIEEPLLLWHGNLIEKSSESSDIDFSLYEPGGAYYEQYKDVLYEEFGDDFQQLEASLVRKSYEVKFAFIQMEHCVSTLQQKLLAEDHEINTSKSWALFEDITMAVELIHEKKIVHGDLKPGNIFFEGDVKIGDFGQSFFIQDRFGKHGGTPGYSAPELDCGQEFSEKVDVYSLGAIFLDLFYKFKNEADKEEKLWNLRRNDIPKDWLGDSFLLKQLTARRPSERPSTYNILEYLRKRLHDIDAPGYIGSNTIHND